MMTLKFVSQNSRYAVCKCPFHNDRHASAVVYKRDKKFVCFTCNVTMPLSEVLSKLGIPEDEFDVEATDEFLMPDLLEDNFTFAKPSARALDYMNDRRIDTSRLPHYVVSPRGDNGVGFLFKTMLGEPIGMQVRLFPEKMRVQNVRYVLEGKRSEMFGYYREYKTKKYKHLAAFEKAFGTLRAQQVSDLFGLSVAAICTAGSHIQWNLLNLVDLNTVFFFDNDRAGRKAGEFVKSRGFRVIIPHCPTDEMNDADLAEMLGKVYGI